MKPTRPHGLSALAVITSCLLIPITIWSLFQVNSHAQQQCTTPPQQNSSGWRPGANVTVVFEQNSFSAAEMAAIQRAFQNWNSSNGPIGNRPGGVIELNHKKLRALDESLQTLSIGHRYLVFLKYIPSTGSYTAFRSDGSFQVTNNKIIKLTKESLPVNWRPEMMLNL